MTNVLDYDILTQSHVVSHNLTLKSIVFSMLPCKNCYYCHYQVILLHVPYPVKLIDKNH